MASFFCALPHPSLASAPQEHAPQEHQSKFRFRPYKQEKEFQEAARPLKLFFPFNPCRGDGIRTHDPLLPKQVR